MNEHIITFLPGQLPGEDIFGIEMTGITYPDARYHIERENSRVLCLEYIIRGEGSVTANGKTFYPKQGDVYLLALGTRHSYRADPAKPWEKIWMNVYGSLCGTLVKAYGLETEVLFPDCPLYPLFREFLFFCENYRKDARQLAERTALIFHEILLKLSAHRQLQGETGERPVSPAWRLREYIDGHIYEKLAMPALSEAMNLSASQLTRIFREAYGQTPYEYVLSRKMDTACLLLENTGLSVKEIAYRLNFADEHYFSNVFRKRMGTSPGGWKQAGGQRTGASAGTAVTPGCGKQKAAP